jgi:hypothetical protein
MVLTAVLAAVVVDTARVLGALAQQGKVITAVIAVMVTALPVAVEQGRLVIADRHTHLLPEETVLLRQLPEPQ